MLDFLREFCALQILDSSTISWTLALRLPLRWGLSRLWYPFDCQRRNSYLVWRSHCRTIWRRACERSSNPPKQLGHCPSPAVSTNRGVWWTDAISGLTARKEAPHSIYDTYISNWHHQTEPCGRTIPAGEPAVFVGDHRGEIGLCDSIRGTKDQRPQARISYRCARRHRRRPLLRQLVNLSRFLPCYFSESSHL